MFRFLIIDDNEADAVTLSYLVEERYGKVAHCEVASTLHSALDWLDERKHEHFDAALLDLNLPESQGLETFRALNGAVRGRIPIVVYTGRDDERGLRDQLIAEGASDYLPKGQVQAEQVFETLRDAAQRARFSARLRPEESYALQEAERRTAALVDNARRSEPPIPGGKPSSELLLAEVMESQGDILRDVVQQIAVMRERQEKVMGRVAQTESTTATLQDATSTLKTEALNLETEQTRLRDMNAANKAKIAVLGLAVLSLGWALGKDNGWIFKMLMQLVGVSP